MLAHVAEITLTYSGTVLDVLFKLRSAGGDVEQAAAVQLTLQVGLGFIFQHPPGGVQKSLLKTENKTQNTLI